MTNEHRSKALVEAASMSKWKVGIDIGSSTIAYHESSTENADEESTGFLCPTVVSYPSVSSPEDGGAIEILVGEGALKRWRNHRVVYPLKPSDLDFDLPDAPLLALASSLRKETTALREGAWGVIAAPAQATCDDETRLRAAANRLFERVLVVDTPTLCARTLFHEIGTMHSVLIDLGATSTRFHLMAVQSPLEAGELIVDFGGDHVDALIRDHLQATYPDLELTRETLTALKETLAFVTPYEQRCTVSVVLGETVTRLDVGPIIREACEALMSVVQDGVRQVLSSCPSDMLDQFAGSIYLFGGGARMPGVSLRLENDLRADGLDQAAVRALPAPRRVVANGALKWALSTGDARWGIPLFEYS